jgi:tRNA(fMet)-specific endonuclease VapC
MSFSLDTNILVDLLRKKDPTLRETFVSHPPSEYVVSEIVHAELLHGVQMSQKPEENLHKVKTLLAPLQCIPFSGTAADLYADIKSTLQRNGLLIGANDLLIAATARSRNDILITRNCREFSRVPGLRIQEW